MNISSELLGTPTRTEQIKFSIELTSSQIDKFSREIEIITRQAFKPVNCESLTLDYSIMVEYFGKVAQTLEAILRLRHEGVLIGIQSNEINYGRSLIIEIGKMLKELNG